MGAQALKYRGESDSHQREQRHQQLENDGDEQQPYPYPNPEEAALSHTATPYLNTSCPFSDLSSASGERDITTKPVFLPVLPG